MAISNGYDETQAYNALSVRRGFRQPTLAGMPTLNTANKTCNSGRYYEDEHEACKIQILFKTQEDYAINADGDDTNFNTFLTNTERAVVNASLSSVFTKPCVIDKPAMLHERLDRTAKQYITNSGKFVGVKLWLASGNFAAQLHSVALLFDGAATFNLHLYSDLKKAVVWSQSVTTVANDLKIVELDEKILRPLDASTKGGTFYLGYFQDDLGDVRASDYGSYNRTCFSPLGFDFFEASEDADYGFDRDNYSCNSQTYGLNLQVSTYYDYTQFIVSRSYEFDTLLGLQMAARCINIAHGSIRENSTERALADKVAIWYAELRQNQATEGMPFSDSIEKKINREVKKLQESFYPKAQPVITTPCQ